MVQVQGMSGAIVASLSFQILAVPTQKKTLGLKNQSSRATWV